MQLVIGNKAYSSWSLRPWLLLKQFGIDFEEVLVPLYQADTAARLAPLSPSGKVPCLIDGDVTVWDSLAIAEYLAERFADLPIWPVDRKARAFARSICAEMHAGFGALRQHYTCNFRRTYAWKERGGAAALADGARIIAIWQEARSRFGSDGPFLFGAFSAADAMYAPVVARFTTYSWPLPDVAAAYARTIRDLPAYQDWLAAGATEPWFIADYEYAD
ncbi:glutathione S-transferase family protein [Oryzibacter oryziterrae]|uniref:glutathione S-transferase family protein n=1 Tax=Oryzibacter oryziterrae TaxID=2766474 RepID=UPI001F34EB4D|nr:glutathione S-transferase family protein [Oryzibacter oryziterrae]